METSECPICERKLPVIGLERHVNAHLDEVQRANDHALALDLASVSPSRFQVLQEYTQGCQGDEEFYESDGSGRIGKRHKTGVNVASSSNAAALVQFDADNLVSLQKRGAFKIIDGGIMSLLRSCLNSESRNLTCTIISGYVDHFESCASEDVGWGCGWRNIQMLSSHVLRYKWGREALFGGVGFVPDIPSLQQWLELAWSFGFDAAGAEFYHHKIHGSKEWIGTTECAALFRYFGLRARIVDFSSSQQKNGQASIERWLCKNKPMQAESVSQVHPEIECDLCGTYPIRGTRYKSKKMMDFDVCSECFYSNNISPDDYEELVTSATTKTKNVAHDEDVNHESLVKWVWSYFTGGIKDSSLRACTNQLQGQVFESECTPLYFQHQGHSRTIVGMQRRKKKSGGKEDIFLLVLDPSCKTEELIQSLRCKKQQWQRLIKRGVHTLKKQSYQVCYIEPGIAGGEEREELKILKSDQFSY